MSDGGNRVKLRLFRWSSELPFGQSSFSTLLGLSYTPSFPVLLRLRRLLPSPYTHELLDREYRRLLGLDISSFREILFKCPATFSECTSSPKFGFVVNSKSVAKVGGKTIRICSFPPIALFPRKDCKSLKLGTSILSFVKKVFGVKSKGLTKSRNCFGSQKSVIVFNQLFYRFQLSHTCFSFLRQYFNVLVLLLFVGSKVGFRRLRQSNRLYILSHAIHFPNVYPQKLKNLISKSVKKTCQVLFFEVMRKLKNFSFTFWSILLIFRPKNYLYQTIS